MFGWKKKVAPQASPDLVSMRDTLFGDMPLEAWGPPDAAEPPWVHFAEARRRLAAGNAPGTAEALIAVLHQPGLESRHYLQAYHHLRRIGADPPDDIAKQLLGVVVEVPVEGGLDLLAAYVDGSSRYYNFTGTAIVMDAPDDEVRAATDALLAASQTVVAQIGPWTGDRPSPPPPGQARLNFLTPSGLHFGQAAFDDLMRDAMGGPVLRAATALMTLLVHRAEQRRGRGP